MCLKCHCRQESRPQASFSPITSRVWIGEQGKRSFAKSCLIPWSAKCSIWRKPSSTPRRETSVPSIFDWRVVNGVTACLSAACGLANPSSPKGGVVDGRPGGQKRLLLGDRLVEV